ncbi:hypothetical protein [Roseivirga seohaensis]|uniref:hypothetical protein n=1 Tax=Roseivirga seohaensis TaxID=1914963 RepID=UPI003BAC50D0
MIKILLNKDVTDRINSFPHLIDTNKRLVSKIHDPLLITTSAKSAFRIVAEKYVLQRSDEVFISTTSDSTFVSSCVTSTFFNYSGVSRELTNRTKLIVIIHEFGFINPNTEDLILSGMKAGIPVIEDKAHFIDLEARSSLVGDFTIHSIPKSFPVMKGGLLIDHNKVIDNNNISNRYLCSDFDIHSLNFDFLQQVNERRKYLYGLYQSLLNVEEIFTISDNDVPFCFGFIPNINIEKFEHEISPYVELLRNHVDGQILIPLNPFFKDEEHLVLIKKIEQLNNE